MTLYRDIVKNFIATPDRSLVDNYKLLKDIIGTDDRIDAWFKGVIGSLSYRPNQKLLVLCGKQGSGKTRFLSEIFPEPLRSMYRCSENISDNIIYEHLIVDTNFQHKKDFLRLSNHNFKIFDEMTYNPQTEKRLVSYATTCQDWKFPERKSVIVVPFDNFNYEEFKYIDKMSLWKQIYHKFKN